MAYEEFIERVQAEVAASHPDWLKKIKQEDSNHVETTSNRFQANYTERELIQNMGEAYGCHTCNKKIEDTPQGFIVDHIPPKEIAGPKGVFRFFPHCDTCASLQARWARDADHQIIKVIRTKVGIRASKANLEAAAEGLKKLGLAKMDIKLICGGDYAASIPGHYGSPNKIQREQVGSKGASHGCHSCGTKQPSTVFHADHCPPREIAMTSWFPKLMERLGAPLNGESFFRPQCPACSHAQGARCATLVREASRIADEVGIIRYTA